MKKIGYDLSDIDQINDYAILSQVAHMYYELDMLQPEIAEKLYFSRSKISRMLKRAHELGIVRIKVKRFMDRLPAFENKLRDRFGLKNAIVLTSFEDEAGVESTLDALTNFAALYVSSLVKGDFVMGISGGKTVSRVASKLNKVHPCSLQVVQLIGASTNTYVSGDPRDLINQVSGYYGGTGHYLNAPLYIDDLYAKEILENDPTVKNALVLMKHLSLILTGVGSFAASGDMPDWYGYFTAAHREELADAGAVGSLCAQYYDIDGHRIDCAWNRKCIAINWPDLVGAQMTVAVAAGPNKVYPILGALRGGLIDVLITDANTAARALEQQERLSKEKG